ncbi:hypothetical protein LCGC14_1895500 [marine sediment metagenome]|uniref:Uncharacterized protein n=1 Tax=marine sediment metagenome TaxID=412755 RepID=A0A0F9FYH5_9ZZZZ
MNQMGSRNTLKLGVTMGHLRILVDGNLEETLTILYKQNGRKVLSISRDPNSRLSNETDITQRVYTNDLNLVNYVTMKAKEIHPTPWYRKSRVEVKYQSNEMSGVEIALAKSEENRPRLSGEHA